MFCKLNVGIFARIKSFCKKDENKKQVIEVTTSEDSERENEIRKFHEKKMAASRMNSIEMRNLILEALAIEDIEKTPRRCTFQQYGYRGCINDLRCIVEHLAIKRGIIDEVVRISNGAWACPGELPFYGTNTSFNDAESDLFNEEFHGLIFQNVISPGATGNMGPGLPYFHVTQYGRKCLTERDILPYDPDGYLAKVRAYGADDWDEFYIKEALTCFNAGAYSSSVIMIGLLGEYVANRLISTMDQFLDRNEPLDLTNYRIELNGKIRVSQKYQIYEKYLGIVEKKKDASGSLIYPDVAALKGALDLPAKAIFNTFVRLTRNELAHPSSVKMERMDCLMLFVSFVKYFEIQKNYLNTYNNHI